MPPCPRCASTMTAPPDEYGDYNCLACGEYWPDPVLLARAQALQEQRIAEARSIPAPRVGRKPTAELILDAIRGNPDGVTTSEIAQVTGVRRVYVERSAWTLFRQKKIDMITVTGPLRWRLAA